MAFFLVFVFPNKGLLQYLQALAVLRMKKEEPEAPTVVENIAPDNSLELRL